MKTRPIVLGIDDTPVPRVQGLNPDRSAPRIAHLVGVLVKGLQIIRVLFGTIMVDGMDVTDEIVRMVKESNHEPEIQYIMTDGVTFGGFNLLDVRLLHEQTGKKIITLTDTRPDLDSMRAAIQKVFPDTDRRLATLDTGSPIVPLISNPEVSDKQVYVHFEGLSEQDGINCIRKTTRYSAIPESLRMAHLLATDVPHLLAMKGTGKSNIVK